MIQCLQAAIERRASEVLFFSPITDLDYWIIQLFIHSVSMGLQISKGLFL